MHLGVQKGVGSNFMAPFVNPPDQRRVFVSHPAQGKKGRLDVAFFEKAEQPVRVFFNTGR